MLAHVSTIITTLLLESERVIPGQEKYNMATFMVLFLLITIEVVVVKVVTSDMERDEESHPGLRAAATFFDHEDWCPIRYARLRPCHALGVVTVFKKLDETMWIVSWD